MRGMVVERQPGLTRAPSEHFAAHFRDDELSAAVAALIDGEHVQFQDEDAAAAAGAGVIAITKRFSDSSVRIALIEVHRSGTKCFVVDVWARSGAELDSTPDNRNALGTPNLPADVQDGLTWRLYNCSVALTPWSRAKLLQGEWPT